VPVTASEDNVDPFRLLVDHRAEADAAGTDPEKARERALVEASKIIRSTAEKSANFMFRSEEHRYVREEAVQAAAESLYKRCTMIYDDGADPPEKSWKKFIDKTVTNKGCDILKQERRHGGKDLGSAEVFSLDAPDSTGNPTWVSIRAYGVGGCSWIPAGVADLALHRACQDALLRRFSRLRADLESGELVCAFHPGRRCSHQVTGRPNGRCKHRDVVLEVIKETVTSAVAEPMRTLLIDRTGYDGNRQGHQLRRHVYRCLDWFTYLLFRDFSSPFAEDWSTLSELSRNCVAQHLLGDGTDAPSETTICILMNDYPDVPIPRNFLNNYGRRHLTRGQGEPR
jgi:hypothetical protein